MSVTPAVLCKVWWMFHQAAPLSTWGEGKNNCSHNVTYFPASRARHRRERCAVGFRLLNNVGSRSSRWTGSFNLGTSLRYFCLLCFQLLSQCNARFVECFSAHKDCNKEKNRNSSVVPCEYLPQHPCAWPEVERTVSRSVSPRTFSRLFSSRLQIIKTIHILNLESISIIL